MTTILSRCVCVCMYVCMYVCIYTYIHICICVHMCVCISISISLSIYIGLHPAVVVGAELAPGGRRDPRPGHQRLAAYYLSIHLCLSLSLYIHIQHNTNNGSSQCMNSEYMQLVNIWIS